VWIFGYGRFGRRCAEQLQQEGTGVTVFDRSPDALQQARDAGLATVQADLTKGSASEAVLGSVPMASEAICCLGSDADNLFLLLELKAALPLLTVVVIIEDEGMMEAMTRAGADRIIQPHRIVGRKVAAMVERPAAEVLIEQILERQSRLRLRQIDISRGCPWAGRRLSSLELESRHQVKVIGMLDHERSSQFRFLYHGLDPKLDEGDVLVVVGTPDALDRLQSAAFGLADK
jgi:voltage-gated potassium channel